MRRYKIIVVCICVLLTGCGRENGNIKRSEANIEIQEKQEEVSMNREVCEVIKTDKYFELKNTKNEIYQLDISYKADYNLGDSVIFIYSGRDKIQDNLYLADVYAIYPNDLTELKPAYH